MTIKVKAKEIFRLSRFGEIKNLKRYNMNNNEDYRIYTADEFEVETELAKYLLNETPNPANRAVVEIIEVIPDEDDIVIKPTTKKVTTKKATKLKK